MIFLGATKVRNGIYTYKGYDVYCCGYYHPDQCVWWEATNQQTGCADYHATTKREIMKMIDQDEMIENK